MEPRLEQVVRVLGVNNPGLLTCVAQSFSSVNVAVESLRLERSETDATLAVIEIAFSADERSSDLICRRISRLIDVLEVTPLAGFVGESESDESALVVSFVTAEEAVLVDN